MKVKILNINIDNISSKKLLKEIQKGGLIVTPNVDHLIKLQKDADFYRIYREADYIICDSKILIWASGFLGNKIQEKISGSDFFPRFYHYYQHHENIKIFLLGGATGVAEQAGQQINMKVNRRMVVGTYSPSFGFEKNEVECQKIVNLINQTEATVLAIGVGAPKQEKWVDLYRKQLKNIKIFLPIGATIDFEAGWVNRAPKWMSEVGLEWFYRLLSEPKRLWKRYLVESLPFFWLVLQQKLSIYQYKTPLNLTLLQAGLLSQEQLRIISQSQLQNCHQRFEEIVVMKGWLKQETIDFFANFPEIRKRHRQKTIGQWCQLAALLDEKQIAVILNEQEKLGLKFGEIALRKGWLKLQTLDFLAEALSYNKQNGSEKRRLKNKPLTRLKFR